MNVAVIVRVAFQVLSPHRRPEYLASIKYGFGNDGGGIVVSGSNMEHGGFFSCSKAFMCQVRGEYCFYHSAVSPLRS